MKEHRYLDQFKELLLFNLFFENTFSDFVIEISEVNRQLKNEIKLNRISFDENEFTRYARLVINDLKSYLAKKDERIEVSTIENHFSYYNLRYFSIESILKMDKSSELFIDLSFPHERAPTEELIDLYFKLQNDFLNFTKKYLIIAICDFIESLKDDITSTKKDILKFNWFKVGLLFATGEIYELKDKYVSYIKIAKNKFGKKWKGYRPYISESYGNSNTNDLNIYSDNDKLKSIYDYCTKNKIEMAEDFKNVINSIKES
jgi:hypothetical protein